MLCMFGCCCWHLLLLVMNMCCSKCLQFHPESTGRATPHGVESVTTYKTYQFSTNCQYRQHRTSNIQRTELMHNSLIVDPIKGCTEINLYDPSLLPTLHCNSQCMRHTEKCFTGTQTFPISKLHSINRRVELTPDAQTL